MTFPRKRRNFLPSSPTPIASSLHSSNPSAQQVLHTRQMPPSSAQNTSSQPARVHRPPPSSALPLVAPAAPVSRPPMFRQATSGQERANLVHLPQSPSAPSRQAPLPRATQPAHPSLPSSEPTRKPRSFETPTKSSRPRAPPRRGTSRTPISIPPLPGPRNPPHAGGALPTTRRRDSHTSPASRAPSASHTPSEPCTPPSHRAPPSPRTPPSDHTTSASRASSAEFPRGTSSRKRARSNHDEILRVLAADALKAMRGQGLTPPPNSTDPERARPRTRARTSGDFDKENRVSPPQSPKSFYRKIGLAVDAPPRPLSARVPLAPISVLDDCVTPDRAVRRKTDPDANGSITPARVQAAKCLLSLMQ